MLTLVKFLITLGVLFGLAFAVVFSLATLVTPKSRDMGFTVPPSEMIYRP